ncbi:MAG: tetratricopeptide repeat protein, partial [Promethearchaeota archaeon]
MTDLNKVNLESANQLFIEGLYFKALDTVKKYEQLEDIAPENSIICNLLKSSIYSELGAYDDALKFAEQAYSKSQELGNKSFLVDSNISKAWALTMLKDFDSVLVLISKGEALLSELILLPESEFARKDAHLKLIKSQLCLYKNRNVDKALQYGEQGLKISEKYNHKKELALSLQFSSVCYLIVGNLDRALNYLKRCLDVQKTYRKSLDWMTLKDLGVVHGMRGELDLALEYTKQSLAYAEEIGNKDFIAQCLNNSSLIYREKGNLNRAQKALERNLTIWEETGNKMRILGGLDSLFIVSLDANSLEQAQNYLLRMQKIKDQVKNEFSDMVCRVNGALILKMSQNPLDQEKSKIILQKVVKEDIINWEFTERALLHLCDIFLLELQKFNKQDVLREINLLINRLLDFANSQNSFRLLAETNLLQGKLALIQMNLGDA